MQAGLPWLLLGALVVGGLGLGRPAVAQMTVNPGALDLLPAAPAPGRPAPARPAAPRPAPHAPNAAAGRPAAAGVPNPRAAPGVAATRPTLPTVPPAIAALPPAAPVPAARPQPIPLVPVAADAPGMASALAGGLRVTFGAERQDLNPASEAALRELARRVRGNEQATINIYAYATGTPDDPSAARRLSLGRALAARAVLINEGIASPRIYPRALGPGLGETDRDRVDVVVGAPGPPRADPGVEAAAPPALPPGLPPGLPVRTP